MRREVLHSGAMSRALLIAAALATLAESAVAAPPPEAKPTRQCFSSSQVTNFRAGQDDRTLYLRVGVKDVYRLDLLAPCPEIDMSNQIAIRSRGGAMNICSGLDAVILAPGLRGARRCEVKTVQRMTPEAVAALPSRERP